MTRIANSPLRNTPRDRAGSDSARYGIDSMEVSHSVRIYSSSGLEKLARWQHSFSCKV